MVEDLWRGRWRCSRRVMHCGGDLGEDGRWVRPLAHWSWSRVHGGGVRLSAWAAGLRGATALCVWGWRGWSGEGRKKMEVMDEDSDDGCMRWGVKEIEED